MKQIIQKVVAGGIVIQNNKVLIVQRSSDEEVYPNLWEVPSGKKEPMEKVINTVIREVKEETNLNTEIIKVVDVFNFYVQKEDETRDVTQINFLLKIVDDSNVKLNDEHQKFAWIGKNELDKYNLSTETKASIQKAFLLK